MTFDEHLEQILMLLQRDGRVTYRALKRRLEIDDDYLNQTTRHWDTHAASCEITVGAVCVARSAATAAVTSGV